MCSSGATMRSSIWRSSSAAAPCTVSSARLPVSFAAWRTSRVRRCTWRWNGTMRVRIRLFCSSVMTRACCVEQTLRLARQRLEQPLNARDVARGLGERARELLQRRIAVQFKRIEVVAPRLDIVMPIQHLRLGLDFQSAQLFLQARHGARQLGQIEIDGIDLLVEARAENAHLAGIVEHGVEQIRIHARHLHALRRRGLTARQDRCAAQLQARHVFARRPVPASAPAYGAGVLRHGAAAGAACGLGGYRGCGCAAGAGAAGAGAARAGVGAAAGSAPCGCCARSRICAIRSRALARQRCRRSPNRACAHSSSRLACMTACAWSSPATAPLSICMTKVSSS